MIRQKSAANTIRHPAKAWTKLALLAVLGFTLSGPESALAANKTFTGPGNFSTATLWNGNTLPAAGDNLTIRGTCTFDNAAANLAYGSFTLGAGATAGALNWPVGGTNTLNVTAVSAAVAGSSINMTNGGTLQIRTSWSTTNMTFTPGAGTIHWNITGANSTLPAAIATYNNLTITSGTRTASLGVATTVNGNLLISSGTLDVTTSNFALNVKGNFTNNATFTARAGTVTLDGTGAQSLGGTATTTFNHLTINKTSGTATLAANANINGNLSISAGTLDLAASNPAVNLAGNFTNSGTFNSGTGVFTFNGSAAQTVTGATTFTNLTLDNSSTGLTLSNDVTVTGTLDFSKGKITTGSNKVSIGSAGSLTGSSGSKYVVGTLEKSFTGATSFTFAIGDASDYTPVDAVLSSVTSAGSLAVSQTPGDHPNIGTSSLDPNQSVNRYWTLVDSGGLAGTYDATFNYVTGDKDTGSNPPDFEIERYSGGSWFTTTIGTRTGTSIQATGLSDFSDFAIAEPSPTPNHYVISHAGTGVNCQPEVVTVTAHRPNHNVLATVTGTITLEAFKDGTGTKRGDWTLNTGSGTFTPGASDSGTATYTFVAADNGQAMFNLRYTYPETVNINITQGAVTENSGTANNGSEPAPTDPTLTFANSGFRITDGSNGAVTIGTQIAGKESNVNPGTQSIALQAIRTDTTTFACVGVFADSTVVNVELGFECNNPTTCQPGKNVSITNNATTTAIAGNANGSVTSYTTVPLQFTGTMSEAIFTLNYPDAGQIKLHARREIPLESGAGSGNFMIGSSNNFVVRPFAFDIDSDGKRAADWSDDSTLNGSAGDDSYAVDATGTTFAKAGANFNATIRAVIWQSADDGDNNGAPDAGANLTNNLTTPNFGHETATEKVDVTSTLVLPSTPGDAGMLSSGNDLDFSAVSGSLTTTLAFDEVGIIDLTAALDDGDYLGSGSNVTATHDNFGRFYPDRLAITDNDPGFAEACTTGANPFTYQDQTFYYGTAPELTLTALNTAGAVTENYGGGTGGAEGFWKLTSTLARTYTDQAGAVATFSELPDTDVTLANHTDFDGDGTLTLDAGAGGDAFMYSRVSVEPEFAANVDLSFTVAALTDSDGACYDPDDNGACDPYPINGLAGATLRFGRLVIGTATGSELLSLAVPLRAEYFSGTAFELNADDTCTGIAATDLILSGGVEAGQTDGDVDVSNGADCSNGLTTASVSDNPFQGGQGGLSFTAPGQACTGFVDIATDLSTGTGLGLDWLRFDWDGDGTLDNDPSGRASFGVFPGQGVLIYRREPWN